MNWRKSFSILNLLLIVCLVFASFQAGTASPQPTQGDTVTVRLPRQEADSLSRLGLQPLLVLDYGSYQWLELSQADFAALSASGASFYLEPQAGTLQVMSYRFDPWRDGEPELSKAMQASRGEAGFRLVQFVGPVQDSWLAELEASGIRVLQYYPYNSFLVWATPEQAQSAQSHNFIRWIGLFHPAYKINSDLEGREGKITNVDIMFYNDGDIDATLESVRFLGGKIIQYYPSQPDKAFYDAIVELPSASVESIAHLDTVLWLGYSHPEPVLDDEMSSQIAAGNYSGGVPFPGYFDWLANLGFDGEGVIWATIDTGVDYDHPDLGPHVVGGYNFPGACEVPGQPGSDCPDGGHGTHVTGIIGGDATGGFSDPNSFLYGVGIAPAYSIYAMNSLSAPAWPPAGGWQEHSKRAVLGNAIGGNNSWTTGEGTNHGYQTSERTHDLMVLDGNFDTTDVAETFIEVFSAGNSGPGSYTLTAPKEAKNLIITASSLNYRVGSIDTISSFSSRGPAQDGRWVPTVAAPGSTIASSVNDTGGSCTEDIIPGTNGLYGYCSGTSMAAPHTSGSVVLVSEWWRSFNSGANPSPEMAKALLVNGAVDMNEGNPIPNIHEGWGRINLTNVMDNGTSMLYFDEETIFANSGESWTISLGVVDPTKPLKISLAWSDAAGAVGANPALVNNLDLTVTNGAETYLGNVFSNGWSSTGGNPDTINNLENVYIENPAGGATITVDATNIVGDAIPYNGDTTDQDFALVCYNCALFPDFTLSATPTAQTICTPQDALYDIEVGSILGYTDAVTLSASGNPSGTTTNFSLNPVIPPDNSQLTIGNTGAAEAGNYSIDILGVAPTSTHTTTVGLEVFTSAPGEVSLISPADGAVDVGLLPTFEWTSAIQGSSYTLEVATDIGFSNIIYTATLEGISHTMESALEPQSSYYWRVVAQNACGAGSFSATFSFTTRTLPCILVVDDDNDNPDVLPYYTDALDSLGYDYDVYDVGGGGSNGPSLGELAGYKMSIWFSGDKFGGSAGPNGDDESNLAAYLDGGGRLFLSSQDYLYDFGLTPFGQDYLGVSNFSSDEGNATTKYGLAGDPIGDGLGPYPLTYPAGFSDYGDIVNAAAGASVAFRSSSGGGNNLDIDKDGGDWKTVFFGTSWVPVYNNNPANGEELLGRIIDWFGGCEVYGVTLSGDDAQTGLPGETLTYTLAVTNTSSLTDTFTVSLGASLFPAEADMAVVGPLDPGETAELHVIVSIPPSALPGEVDPVAVTVTSQGDEDVWDSATLTSSVGGSYGVLLASDQTEGEGAAGSTLTYTVSLTNSGSLADTLVLTYTNVDPGWQVLLAQDSFDLAGGESAETSLQVLIPAGAAAGDQDSFTLQVSSWHDPAKTDEVEFTTTVSLACTAVSEVGFTWEPLQPWVGDEVSFVASALGSEPISYAWDFGDEGSGSGAEAVHVYAAGGAYSVTLVASNLCSQQPLSQSVTVTPLVRLYLPVISRTP